jgi:hypothetical protein
MTGFEMKRPKHLSDHVLTHARALSKNKKQSITTIFSGILPTPNHTQIGHCPMITIMQNLQLY